MSNFEADLANSKTIEKHFRTHPKFPFLKLGDDVEENVCLQLFWRYMILPYLKQLPDKWIEYSEYYESFRLYDGTASVILNFYGQKTKRFLNLSVNGLHEDKFGYDHFVVNTGIDDFRAEVSGNKEDELYFLGMGVDLRHPYALEKAREFLYAFFVEKLPLEEMEKKIERYEKEEAWQFKRRK